MAGFKIEIKGLAELQQRLSKPEVDAKINKVLSKFGNDVRTEAIRRAPVNEGRLRQSIFYQAGQLQVTIGANVDYAAYVEFGTRKFAAAYVATLPASWQVFARNYKGPAGGTFDQLVMRIYEWVRKKGIRANPKQGVQEDNFSAGRLKQPRKAKKQNKESEQQQLAYAIALKILRDGIKPQPFLFPAYNAVISKLENKIEL